jgi:hypothetical protein
MKPLYNLLIHYTNGSSNALPFNQYSAVRDFYQHSISYTGARVKRVEVEMHGGGTRAIWDIFWDQLSQVAGLQS